MNCRQIICEILMPLPSKEKDLNMQDRQNIGTSENGINVWYDPINSHAATHFNDTPQLKELIEEIIPETNIDWDYMKFHTDFGRPIGMSDLVANDPGDELFYAKRLNRDTFTVFNKSKSPQPCPLVAAIIEKKDDGSYELLSAWVGPANSPSLPGTERETPDSKDFWNKNSLAWGTQEIQPGTETTICPW